VRDGDDACLAACESEKGRSKRAKLYQSLFCLTLSEFILPVEIEELRADP
jgi:hypothetical protein